MKHAKVTISGVQLNCPHCGTCVLTPEGHAQQTECVACEPGEATCEDCGKTFIVPRLYFALGRTVRLDPRDWPDHPEYRPLKD